jgi:hypothetical protein
LDEQEMMTFEEIFNKRPDKQDIGGSGYSRLKHIYDVCKEVKPEMVVESGTWKGNSSHMFYHACPGAEIHCYDIQFEALLWESKDINYHQVDIEQDGFNYEFDPEKTIIFFDDHINQEQRLNWAIGKGFKMFLFDDNVPEEEAKVLKRPPVPTLQMIDFPNNYEFEEHVIFPYLGNDTRQTYLTWIKL